MGELYNPPLQVVGFIASHRGDDERGPLIRMRRHEASLRMVSDGELVWVHGPRRNELAKLEIDDELPRGGVVVRDIFGLTITEIVTITKPNLDAHPSQGRLV